MGFRFSEKVHKLHLKIKSSNSSLSHKYLHEPIRSGSIYFHETKSIMFSSRSDGGSRRLGTYVWECQNQTNRKRTVFNSLYRGHNGVLSVIGAVKSKEFKRLQIGIGRPTSRDPEDVANYVLQNFRKNERESLSAVFVKAEELLKKEKFLWIYLYCDI